jgi:hypothetical protein
MSSNPGPRPTSASKPSATDAEFPALRRRLLRLAKQRVGVEAGFRATRGVVALAVERYADCARAGQAGFNKRVGVVVRGCSSKHGSPLHALRRTDPDIAEEEDEACLRVWIGVLRRLSANHRESGLPGPNIIGGGRPGGRARADEIEVNGLFYSPKRWRQLAEDSAIACAVLHTIEKAAKGAEAETARPTASRASGTQRAVATGSESSGQYLPMTPSVTMKTVLAELRARHHEISERSIRRWLKKWRAQSREPNPPRGTIPVWHLAEMAMWLNTGQSYEKRLAKPLVEIATAKSNGQLPDKFNLSGH